MAWKTSRIEYWGGGVLLSNLSYDEVPIENDSVIYCDPPYKNTNTYIDDFNHEKFYQWLRGCREKNQQVFISEYQMPSDFFEVYSKEKTCLINANTTTFKLEKLFSTLKYSPIELLEWWTVTKNIDFLLFLLYKYKYNI